MGVENRPEQLGGNYPFTPLNEERAVDTRVTPQEFMALTTDEIAQLVADRQAEVIVGKTAKTKKKPEPAETS